MLEYWFQKIIMPPRAHFGSENESLKGLNVDNAFVGIWLSYCHSVTVSSVRYTKHCVDGQPSEHSLWHTLVWCCLDYRRWKQCRNQIWLALLLWLRTLLGMGTVSASGCSVNLTCISQTLTTKITVTFFTIRWLFPPGGRKFRRHDRRLYNRFAL